MQGTCFFRWVCGRHTLHAGTAITANTVDVIGEGYGLALVHKRYAVRWGLL